MANDPNNSSVCWSGGDYYSTSYIMAASKSTDGGANWIRYNLSSGAGATYCLAVNPSNSNIVYAGGYESSAGAIYRTTNGGSSWSKLTATGLSGYVYDLAIDPVSTNTVYAGTGSSVYKSTNGGANWSSTGFSGGRTNALIIDPDNSDNIYAGTYSNGVYRSTNGGSSWLQINGGLGSLAINRMGINPGVYLFAGTDGASLCRWSLQVGVEESQENLETKLVLCVYPNPAKTNTTIQYALPRQTAVDLAIFDIQGRLVRELMQGEQSAGMHSVFWDGYDELKNLAAAGVYFYRLTTEYESAIGKLILVK
jgi:photosystem II stability/assembly factor-like uncharacterized protein